MFCAMQTADQAHLARDHVLYRHAYVHLAKWPMASLARAHVLTYVYQSHVYPTRSLLHFPAAVSMSISAAILARCPCFIWRHICLEWGTVDPIDALGVGAYVAAKKRSRGAAEATATDGDPKKSKKDKTSKGAKHLLTWSLAYLCIV